MDHRLPAYYLHHLRQDVPAGIVVFLVALPLCLGIALASGAPLFSGLIAGMVGGLVVVWASGSQLSVSGPAAGLTVIVLHAIEQLGFDAFLLSVALAGLAQLALGSLRAGVIGAYFPAAVIRGMLAAIGLILILKQLPYAAGLAGGHLPVDGHASLPEAISPGAALVSAVSLGILLLWETPLIRRSPWLKQVPGPLIVVLWGTGFELAGHLLPPALTLAPELLVHLPVLASPGEFLGQIHLPDFAAWRNPAVWTVAGTLTVIASLETLLSLEAVDKLDPHRRVAPTNRELKAQGLGNLLSGLLGGLPLTAVIVRSSANINAGGHTKTSCFVHGVLLLLSVLFFAASLNHIPLACLAAVLLQTGFKLAKPALFRELYRKGWNQFLPFLVTVAAILLTDLLKGMAIGMLVGLYFVLRTNYHAALSLTRHGRNALLRLNKDVSFLNKALLREHLAAIPPDSYLIIDGTRARFIDQDILETLDDFLKSAPEDEITVELKNINGATRVFRPEDAAA